MAAGVKVPPELQDLTVPEIGHAHRARCVEVIDGDTFAADLELDFGAHTWQRIRIHGVDAPEHDTKEGPGATRYLKGLLDGRDLIIRSYKDRRSFERWVADIWVWWATGSKESEGRWDLVASRIIEAEHGTPFMVGEADHPAPLAMHHPWITEHYP